MSTKKDTDHAKKAERYANYCVSNKASVPKQISQAYAVWLRYRKQPGCYKPENLSLVCKLLENTTLPCGEGERIKLADWQCALLSWPLVFTTKKRERAINEIDFLALRPTDISTLIAGLMIAGLARPFPGDPPHIVSVAKGRDWARVAFDKALYILSQNPKFLEEYEVHVTQEEIISKKTGALIRPRTLNSKHFRHSPANFAFIQTTGSKLEARRISEFHPQISTRPGSNYLLITAGAPGSSHAEILKEMEERSAKWLANKRRNCVSLLYQSKKSDLYNSLRR